MATAVLETIAALVKTRLEDISTANGYETDLTTVERPKRIGDWQPQDNQIVLTQETVIRNDELSHPGNPPATAWDVTFNIAALLRPSETNTNAANTLDNQFWADVVKALTNAAAWHNWGGNAINSTVTEIEEFQAGDGSSSGFQLKLNVLFRTDEDDPFTVRA